MTNALNSRRLVIVGLVHRIRPSMRFLTAVFLTVTALGFIPTLVSQAQTSPQSKVVNVSTQPAGAGTVVSLGADGPLSRAQSWQDGEGYHLVLPNTAAVENLKSARGVKIRKVGTSIEVLLQTKPGSNVAVQSEGNRLHLFVDNKLEPKADGFTAKEAVTSEQPTSQEPVLTTPLDSLSVSSAPGSAFASNSPVPVLGTTTPATGASPAPASVLPLPGETIARTDATPYPQPSAEIRVEEVEGSALATIFSATSIGIVITLGLFGLFVSHKLRSRQAVKAAEAESDDAEWVDDQTAEGKLRPQPEETALVKASSGTPTGASRQILRPTVAGPTSLFGAYRIDQEVGKLVLGQPHRMDVLASRAIDDRRAIETSLVKSVNAADLDDTARRRAREALEEYGFVARQCATLLLSPDAFERTSAARSLGDIKSEAALPFLLESLYDTESIVRNQAVVSIGELKVPSAIGALLDIARTHPDVPSALLSRTLSACSVEGLDFFDAVITEPAQLVGGFGHSVVEEITHLEPLSQVEELPETSDDEALTSALSQLESGDLQERADALKTLALFRVRSAVDAIERVARYEPEPNLRSIAIASLGAIDHESVFPAILIGMADESREVRAGSARALNRLSFDRTDAYVRVIENGDEETVSNVAKACIKSGIVGQNIERLATSDHRQAYETFAIICLLAKANMNDPIVDAIADHPNSEVRLRAAHLLSCTGHPAVFELLRQLAVREGVSEEVKTALLEAMYRLDQQAKLNEKETVEASEADSEPHFETSEVETFEDAGEQGFAFAFEPTSVPELLPDLEPEVDTKLDELEM